MNARAHGRLGATGADDEPEHGEDEEEQERVRGPAHRDREPDRPDPPGDRVQRPRDPRRAAQPQVRHDRVSPNPGAPATECHDPGAAAPSASTRTIAADRRPGRAGRRLRGRRGGPHVGDRWVGGRTRGRRTGRVRAAPRWSRCVDVAVIGPGAAAWGAGVRTRSPEPAVGAARALVVVPGLGARAGAGAVEAVGRRSTPPVPPPVPPPPPPTAAGGRRWRWRPAAVRAQSRGPSSARTSVPRVVPPVSVRAVDPGVDAAGLGPVAGGAELAVGPAGLAGVGVPVGPVPRGRWRRRCTGRRPPWAAP